MRSPALVSPSEPSLLARLRSREVVLRAPFPGPDPELLALVAAGGNRLLRVVVEADLPLAALTLPDHWKDPAVTLRVPSSGRFRDLVTRLDRIRELGTTVQIPAAEPSALVDLRLLSSVGIPVSVAFDQGVADWDGLSDLMEWALLERAPHGRVEPFVWLASGPPGESRRSWSRFDLDHPAELVHLDASGRIALTRAELDQGSFVLEDLERLDELTEVPAYRDRVFAWQRHFLDSRPCARCAGYPLCHGRFDGDHIGTCPATGLFTDLLQIVDASRRAPGAGCGTRT